MNSKVAVNTQVMNGESILSSMVHQPHNLQHHNIHAHNLLATLSELEKIKPFVSLKLFGAQSSSTNTQPILNPASGLAIITYVIAGEATYCDSTGKQGVLKKDGWAWIISGSGILHSIEPATPDYLAVQVCIALSPALENSPPQSAYQMPALNMPNDPVQVLMGWHGTKRSEFAAPSLVNYLVVHLKANQQWTYELPLNHSCTWVAPICGDVEINNYKTSPHRPGFYERPIDKIHFNAVTDAVLVLGSAVEFDYDLVSQDNSVHTSIESLQNGLLGIYQLHKTQPQSGGKTPSVIAI